MRGSGRHTAQYTILSQADLYFLLKFKNQWGLFPTSLNEPINLNRAGFTTSTREEKSRRELLHWRKLTWREEGRGEQLAQQQGQTFVLATPDKSSSKQKDKKMKEAGLFLSKTSLLPWNMHCFQRSSRYANKRWIISPSKSPGSRTLVCMDTHRVNINHYDPVTYENVWKSILLGGSLNCGEQKKKKKPDRQCKCHCCFWKITFVTAFVNDQMESIVMDTPLTISLLQLVISLFV